jgi:hypothetical protein
VAVAKILLSAANTAGSKLTELQLLD